MNQSNPVPQVHIITEKLPSGEYTAKAQIGSDLVQKQAWDELDAIRDLQQKIREMALGSR